MESMNNAINHLQPNVYMTPTNLKDTSFSVPVHTGHQQHLKFHK